MSNPRRNKKRNDQLNLLKTIGKYCFVAIFSLSLFAQAAFYLNQGRANKLNDGKNSVYDGTHHTLSPSLRFAFCVEPDDNEDANDETLATHDTQLWSFSAVPENDFRYIVEKTSFTHFISGIQNREQVSKVILHHSWKSFIS